MKDDKVVNIRATVAQLKTIKSGLGWLMSETSSNESGFQEAEKLNNKINYYLNHKEELDLTEGE